MGTSPDVKEAPAALRLRPMLNSDLDSVVSLHLECFPDYFVTRLGPRFLRLLYAETLGEISIVAMDEEGTLLGYHLTFTKASRTFSTLMLQRGPMFLWAALPTAFRGFREASRVVGALFKPARVRLPQGYALSMYTAVSPAARGRGVAKQLLVDAIAAARDRGIVALVGENEDDDRLCALYESVGFVRHHSDLGPGGQTRVTMVLDVGSVTAG